MLRSKMFLFIGAPFVAVIYYASACNAHRARYVMTNLSVRLSVCLSVQGRYCVQTNRHISLYTLFDAMLETYVVFLCRGANTKIPRGTPSAGA